MSWTYSGDPATSDKDAVRFLTGDTDAGDQLASDEEIAYALSQRPDVRLAAAVVCDVYEHAFYVDYQNRKQEYVNRFVNFLDWEEINRRWQALNH